MLAPPSPSPLSPIASHYRSGLCTPLPPLELGDPISRLLTPRRARFQLALAWFLGFDGFDVAALSLLSHGPTVSRPPPFSA